MNRQIIRSSTFVRSARRFLKKHPQMADAPRHALAQLSEDAFHPSLKTHKLKGDLSDAWACCTGYDVRIVFMFVQREDQEAILLQSVGTHNEVY